MKHLKPFSILIMTLWFASCSSDIPFYSFNSKVNVLLVNKSENPYYMWMGHNPLPPPSSILAGNHADTVLNLKINVYDVMDDSNTMYQEDWLDYKLQVNIRAESDTIEETSTVEIHEIYSKLYRLKFYWNGRTLTYKYEL